MPRKVCVRHSEAVVHALLICRMILFIIIGNACVIFLRISFFRNQARFLRIWFLRNELLVFAIIARPVAGWGRFSDDSAYPFFGRLSAEPDDLRGFGPWRRVADIRSESGFRIPQPKWRGCTGAECRIPREEREGRKLSARRGFCRDFGRHGW